MQKALISILVATTLALGTLCVVQHGKLRTSNERMRTAEEASRADADIRETQSTRLVELERANELLDLQVQEFAAATRRWPTNEARKANNLTMAESMRAPRKSAGGENDAPEEVFGKGMGDMLGKMMKDPTMREMMREQQNATINMMYSGLFKELNLSAEEKERFKAILVDAQMKNIESTHEIFGEKKEGEVGQPPKILVDAKAQSDAELRELLGDDRFAQYEDYQKNLSESMQLDQLKAKMAAENLPLDDQQMVQLLQAMKEEKAAVPPGISMDNMQTPNRELFTAENFDNQILWMQDYNRRVLDRAGQILSFEQLKQFREFQEQQGTMQKVGLNMARRMFGSEKAGSTPETSR